MTKTMKIKSSRMENGIEICNSCQRPSDSPYRYETFKGETRGCVASCHDKHVAHNTNPNWMAPRMVLPKWITEARRAMPMFERASV